jgi:hypothetical protein
MWDRRAHSDNARLSAPTLRGAPTPNTIGGPARPRPQPTQPGAHKAHGDHRAHPVVGRHMATVAMRWTDGLRRPRLARAVGGCAPSCVTSIQRFASALNLTWVFLNVAAGPLVRRQASR